MRVVIENEKKNSYAFVSSKGGTVTEFVYDGLNIIYPYRKVGEGIGGGKYRGGIPFCFPFFGSPKEKFNQIPRHGWLRDEILEPHEVSNEEESWFSKFFEGRDDFPWRFYCRVGVSLIRGYALDIYFDIQRLYDGHGGKAPINPAFHLYFKNLGKREAEINGEKITVFNEEAKIIPVAWEDWHTIDLGKKKVEIFLNGDFDKGETHLVLWSDSDDYFCIEPVLTHPDDFDTPKGVFLKEGEKISLNCILSVMK